MGTDDGASVVLDGVAEALAAKSDLAVVVVGDKKAVEPFAAAHERCRAVVSTQVIAMDEHPAEAVREKPNASIVCACKAVRAGEAEALFSAGSTGAILAASTLGVGRIKGVKRPALAAVFPGVGGHETLVLDLGANADAKPEMLVQFAHMGSVYARAVLGKTAPTVALLSNGSEDTKGSELAKSYFAALAAAGEAGQITFAGNCEGNDLLLGSFDVIVCDGFTGNVALKTIEGTAKFLVGRIKGAAKQGPRAAAGALMLKPALTAVARELSGDAYGGAMLVGLKAPVLIGHGHTSAEAVKNGVLAAAAAVEAGTVEAIAQGLAAE
jgi:glycerol-3-phosphate acyltransferase PlsX